ncbi:hypothetical protein OKW37_000582 [Paraburkholderia sp. MM5482-R2]
MPAWAEYGNLDDHPDWAASHCCSSLVLSGGWVSRGLNATFFRQWSQSLVGECQPAAYHPTAFSVT